MIPRDAWLQLDYPDKKLRLEDFGIIGPLTNDRQETGKPRLIIPMAKPFFLIVFFDIRT